MTDALVKQLQKEVERLKRRNKVLIRRLKRLQSESTDLENELETIEALNEVAPLAPIAPKMQCPTKCGGELKWHEAGPAGKILLCNTIQCKYREVKKC